jgi:AraC-like DNA-binding protein
LLTQTRHTLDEVAQLTGFSSAAYFSVVFKRAVGVTAGSYRAQHAS